jgi:2'-5' RNA ligase
MLRLFVALDLPPLVKAQLAALSGGIPGAKWIPPENYHLTLRFIGEIEPWLAEEVDAALAAIRAPRFDLALAGLGTFEKGGRIQSIHVTAERVAAHRPGTGAPPLRAACHPGPHRPGGDAQAGVLRADA